MGFKWSGPPLLYNNVNVFTGLLKMITNLTHSFVLEKLCDTPVKIPKYATSMIIIKFEKLILPTILLYCSTPIHKDKIEVVSTLRRVFIWNVR